VRRSDLASSGHPNGRAAIARKSERSESDTHEDLDGFPLAALRSSPCFHMGMAHRLQAGNRAYGAFPLAFRGRCGSGQQGLQRKVLASRRLVSPIMIRAFHAKIIRRSHREEPARPVSPEATSPINRPADGCTVLKLVRCICSRLLLGKLQCADSRMRTDMIDSLPACALYERDDEPWTPVMVNGFGCWIPPDGQQWIL
jgi:hypothetical protein